MFDVALALFNSSVRKEKDSILNFFKFLRQIHLYQNLKSSPSPSPSPSSSPLSWEWPWPEMFVIKSVRYSSTLERPLPSPITHHCHCHHQQHHEPHKNPNIKNVLKNQFNNKDVRGCDIALLRFLFVLPIGSLQHSCMHC